MFKKNFSFYPLHFCCLLACMNVFSQTEVYKSNFQFDDFQSEKLLGSLLIANNTILFNASNYKIHAIDKDNLKPTWETYVGRKSNSAPYLYNSTFFYTNYKNEITSCMQYDLATGEKIKKLPFESINSKPNFVNNIIYCTVLADGGKLLAYDLEENKIVWQKNIGHGVDSQPVYLKNKIIANAKDDNWFEIDYNGNFLKTKSKTQTHIDTTSFFVKNYKFLTHDGKEITQDFLNNSKIPYSDYKTKTNEQNTFILTDDQLLVLGNNKKKVLQLDLIIEFPTDDFVYDAHYAILTTTSEGIWFCYQNQLVHYDFKNNKCLRKVALSKWNPHQIVLENRTIWLISKNDGQLYKFDFEPDQQIADTIEAKAKMDEERFRCTQPDPKMIEAKKAAEEQFKNNKTN